MGSGKLGNDDHEYERTFAKWKRTLKTQWNLFKYLNEYFNRTYWMIYRNLRELMKLLVVVGHYKYT